MAEIDLRKQNNVNVRDMLPHKPMRLSMENKNLLSEKGDIYVGTGESQTVIIEDDTYIIAKTAKVSVPSEVINSNESAILIYDKTNNLQYKKSSESGFVSYTVDQTRTIKDPPGQGTGPKTRLLNNIFNGLTDAQKGYVRSQIGAGSAQGIAGITAGNGIKVDSNTPSSPKVSVNLAQNSGMEFYSNQLKLKIGDGIGVSNGAISVDLAQNSGMVCDSSSSGKLKLNVNSTVQSGDKYWVQIDSDNHPYVNVSVPSSDNQTIAYARTINSFYEPDIVTFSSDARVRLVPGNNISMTADTKQNYIKIDATGTTYTGGNGISVSGGAISLAEGYDVPIEYKSSASSTADFTPNKLYLIGTWGA